MWHISCRSPIQLAVSPSSWSFLGSTSSLCGSMFCWANVSSSSLPLPLVLCATEVSSIVSSHAEQPLEFTSHLSALQCTVHVALATMLYMEPWWVGNPSHSSMSMWLTLTLLKLKCNTLHVSLVLSETEPFLNVINVVPSLVFRHYREDIWNKADSLWRLCW